MMGGAQPSGGGLSGRTRLGGSGAGVERFARAARRRAKASPNYSTAIGKALAIEGDIEDVPTLDGLRPELVASGVGDQVKIEWGRSAAEARGGQWCLPISIRVGGG